MDTIENLIKNLFFLIIMNIREIEATLSRRIVFDPKGFFVIYLQKEDIVVEHYQNVSKGTALKVDTGKLDAVIRGKDSLSIGQTIVREGLISRTDHAIYLGRELMKAEIALKNGLKYEQCEDLKIPAAPATPENEGQNYKNRT